MFNPKKKLKWRKLRRKDIKGYQRLMIRALKDAPDKFVTVLYDIDVDPLIEYLEAQRVQSKIKLSFTHVLNKLIALAVNESPQHNQVVLGSRIYQMEQICMANIFLLPGEEQALTNIILDDPHLKTLEEIADELKRKRDDKLKAYELKQGEFSRFNMWFFNFFFASKLNKLVSEKLYFKVSFEMDLFTNLFLSNHVFNGVKGNFKVLRSITPVVNSVVFHTSGTEKKICEQNGQPVVKNILPLTVSYDHRILHGVHAHHFGQVIQKIASDPDKYF